MSLHSNIPAPVAEFIQSIHEQDSTKLASTFAPSAIMIDESKSYISAQAIKEWSNEALVSHKATIKVESAHVDGQKVVFRVMMVCNSNYKTSSLVTILICA